MIIKRWIVLGDYIVAKDGDVHYVSAQRLCELYGLDRAECIMGDITRPDSLRGLPKDLPRFYPRRDGKYEKEL